MAKIIKGNDSTVAIIRVNLRKNTKVMWLESKLLDS